MTVLKEQKVTSLYCFKHCYITIYSRIDILMYYQTQAASRVLHIAVKKEDSAKEIYASWVFQQNDSFKRIKSDVVILF